MRREWAQSIGWFKLTFVVGLMLVVADSGSPALAQTAPAKAFGNTPVAAPINSQVQVSRRFLQALLRDDYAAAYGQLAPQVQREVSVARFRQLARPIAAQGKRRGHTIELYKMGVRLEEASQGGRPFVAFAWAADAASAQQMPSQWLEVTFNDAEARQILAFQLRSR